MIRTSWEGESETYRYATVRDLPRILDMLADPEVGRWLWFTPAPPEAFQSFFTPYLEAQSREVAEGQVPQTAVFAVLATGEGFLGQGAVIAVEGSAGGFEIGFQLCREAWGRGVGTRLGEFLCAYAIHQCAAFRIEGHCLEGNTGSRAILTRLGLELEGTRPGYRLKGQNRHTELQYGALVSSLDTARFRRLARQSGLL